MYFYTYVYENNLIGHLELFQGRSKMNLRCILAIDLIEKDNRHLLIGISYSFDFIMVITSESYSSINNNIYDNMFSMESV